MTMSSPTPTNPTTDGDELIRCREAFERESGLDWEQQGAEYARDHFVAGWKSAMEGRGDEDIDAVRQKISLAWSRIPFDKYPFDTNLKYWAEVAAIAALGHVPASSESSKANSLPDVHDTNVVEMGHVPAASIETLKTMNTALGVIMNHRNVIPKHIVEWAQSKLEDALGHVLAGDNNMEGVSTRKDEVESGSQNPSANYDTIPHQSKEGAACSSASIKPTCDKSSSDKQKDDGVIQFPATVDMKGLEATLESLGYSPSTKRKREWVKLSDVQSIIRTAFKGAGG